MNISLSIIIITTIIIKIFIMLMVWFVWILAGAVIINMIDTEEFVMDNWLNTATTGFIVLALWPFVLCYLLMRRIRKGIYG
jgi:hypothetical protein